MCCCVVLQVIATSAHARQSVVRRVTMLVEAAQAWCSVWWVSFTSWGVLCGPFGIALLLILHMCRSMTPAPIHAKLALLHDSSSSRDRHDHDQSRSNTSALTILCDQCSACETGFFFNACVHIYNDNCNRNRNININRGPSFGHSA